MHIKEEVIRVDSVKHASRAAGSMLLHPDEVAMHINAAGKSLKM
jgi:hypothetical protein